MHWKEVFTEAVNLSWATEIALDRPPIIIPKHLAIVSSTVNSTMATREFIAAAAAAAEA